MKKPTNENIRDVLLVYVDTLFVCKYFSFNVILRVNE